MKRVQVPGRVNLIGDHTDYTGGLVFPMAIDRYTVIEYEESSISTKLFSIEEGSEVEFSVSDEFFPAMEPRWGRYVAAVASLLRKPHNVQGSITSTIPIGAGLSSSASLEIASALAFGAQLPPTELALMAQKAEQLATGVPTGIMDQLCIASAQEGHGTLIDCNSLSVTHVAIPTDIEIVVQFIAHRTLEGSEYADRVHECAIAEGIIGPLRMAQPSDVEVISDTVIRKRARHVVTENARVQLFISALQAGDYNFAGNVMTESHRSLAENFATSTPVMDEAVQKALQTQGVFGARMTGGGFGGCIVALCEPASSLEGWRVAPSAGPQFLN